MEIRAMRRQIYKEPYATFKFINTFHYSVFKNRNIKSATTCKSAVIVFMKEDNLQKQNLQSQVEELWSASPWAQKFDKNIFLYKQKQRPDFKEAIYISSVIKERLKSKVFDEVCICFKSRKRNKEELVLLELLPVDTSLSFLLPKYLESIIFGMLLETYIS
ncbi:MAG: hypothetical protein K0S61_842 [Anaerocolumna sp.]|jgi:F0F1-type ATP synthase gamma subunit|nr:hypothetical protein [Anaerocolumna sp.]